jgi:hypothetical protein
MCGAVLCKHLSFPSDSCSVPQNGPGCLDKCLTGDEPSPSTHNMFSEVSATVVRTRQKQKKKNGK